MMRRDVLLSFCVLPLLAGFVNLAAAAAPVEKHPPFVAGFDRFHDDPKLRPLMGGLLVTELGCTACHRSRETALRPKPGPVLDGVGERIRGDWIRRYLLAPHDLKPGATMPAVLDHFPPVERKQKAAQLTAYLRSLRMPGQFAYTSTASRPVVPRFWAKGSARNGQRLFHQVGCVACHAPDPKYEVTKVYQTNRAQQLARLKLSPEELRELGLDEQSRPIRSVPLSPSLGKKYDRRALTFFLLQPERVRPGGRMPNLKLEMEEAADLAAYLIPASSGEIALPPAVEAAKPSNQSSSGERSGKATGRAAQAVAAGRRLFVELRCAQCHAVKGHSASRPARAWEKLDASKPGSCLSATPSRQPHYRFSERQAATLRQLLSARSPARPPKAPEPPAVKTGNSTAGPTSDRSLQAALLRLNCYACHERNQRGGLGPQRWRYFATKDHIDIGDEGRIPPPLTGVGFKLQTAWIRNVLAGKGDVRPHLTARMPRFPVSETGRLAEWFAAADRAPQSKPKDILASAEAAAAQGRLLLDAGCVQCHPLRGEALPGVVGVDLAHIGRRVRSSWFKPFLRNPAKLKPQTRMPTFFPGGKSQNREIYDGDVERQIAALWKYLNEIDRHPLPAKLEQGKAYNFELTPQERPLLLRTFMKAAGTHAIAIGYPQQVHVAFDAEAVRWAEAWKGRFLNAHGTWFDRFTPLAAPLGRERYSFVAGNAFAVLKKARQAWPKATGAAAGYRFLGYRLDKRAVPTLLYRFAGYEFAERLTPLAKRAGVVREIQIEPPEVRKSPGDSAGLWLRAAAGPALRATQPHTVVAGRATLRIDPPSLQPQLLRIGKGQQWRVRLPNDKPMTLRITYRW